MTGTAPQMSLEEQERILRKHLRPAIFAFYAFIGRNVDEIERLALQRAIYTGFEQYGDASFRKDNQQLYIETMEEAADGAVYRAIRLARDAGEIT